MRCPASILDSSETIGRPPSRVIKCTTEMEKSHRPWSGESGLIDHEMLGRHLNGIVSPIYYIAGPPAIVKGLHEMLSKTGINHEDIHAEKFTGY